MKRVAIVEDNPDNRLLVSVILRGRYETVEYEDGLAALKGMQESPPDLVLLDISLPFIDGREVLRRMRADERLRSIPVIALTAHAMEGEKESFIEAGFNDYVSKPIVDFNVLYESIRRSLQTAPSRTPIE